MGELGVQANQECGDGKDGHVEEGGSEARASGADGSEAAEHEGDWKADIAPEPDPSRPLGRWGAIVALVMVALVHLVQSGGFRRGTGWIDERQVAETLQTFWQTPEALESWRLSLSAGRGPDGATWGYGGGGCTAGVVELARLRLPAAGAAMVDGDELLPEAVRLHLTNLVEEMRKPLEDALPVVQNRVEPAEMAKLVDAMHANGQCKLVAADDPRILATVGYFTVSKTEDEDRLIANAVPGNERGQRGGRLDGEVPTTLGALTDLKKLRLRGNKTLKMGQRDIRSMYHVTRLREDLSWAYVSAEVCFADLDATTRKAYPGLEAARRVRMRPLTVPMGMSTAVLVTMEIHKTIWRRVAQRAKEELGVTVIILAGPAQTEVIELSDKIVAALVFVDDSTAAGTQTGNVNSVLEILEEEYEKVNYQSHPGKALDALETAPTRTVLGAHVTGDGIVRPAIERMAALAGRLMDIRRAGWTTPAELRCLVGKFVFLTSAARPALSCLSQVYRFASGILEEDMHVRRRVTAELAHELRTMASILPLCCASLGSETEPMLTATDACLFGWGVVEASLDEQGHIALEEAAANECVGAIVDDGSFQLVRADLFRGTGLLSSEGDFIAAKEAAAVNWALARRLRGAATGKRLTMLGDNQAVIGAIEKGRSSSWRMKDYVRQAAAMLLSTGTALTMRYISTGKNVAADDASRGVHPRTGERLFAQPRTPAGVSAGRRPGQ